MLHFLPFETLEALCRLPPLRRACGWGTLLHEMLFLGLLLMAVVVAKEAFGENTPLIGIYTYGEQAPLKSISYLGQTHFHNQSVGILAVGEQ